MRCGWPEALAALAVTAIVLLPRPNMSGVRFVSAASSSDSDPAGRSGSTTYRRSAVLSCTRIAVPSAISRPKASRSSRKKTAGSPAFAMTREPVGPPHSSDVDALGLPGSTLSGIGESLTCAPSSVTASKRSPATLSGPMGTVSASIDACTRCSALHTTSC